MALNINVNCGVDIERKRVVCASGNHSLLTSGSKRFPAMNLISLAERPAVLVRRVFAWMGWGTPASVPTAGRVLLPSFS